MIWICIITFSLLIGICIGSFIMYRKDRNLLNNHNILYNELQNSKAKLNEYQNKLSEHFNYNMQLLNKIAENYQDLYQNMTKNANFFIPNTYQQDNSYTFRMKNTQISNEEQLPINAPKDYTEDTEHLIKKTHDVSTK